MAKKKHRVIQAPDNTTIDSAQIHDEINGIPEAQSRQKLGRGNTTDMRHMFEDALGNDNEILKDFPVAWRDPVFVLKTIYGNGLRLKSRKTVWGKPVLAFEVAITALDDASVFARLDVELPPGYPKIAPVIRLEELTPDTEDLRQELKGAITDCERLMSDDEHMISSILQAVQDKLDDVHAEIERRAKGASLGEERTTVETAALANATLQQQNAQLQQAQEVAVQEAKLAKDVEAHRRRRQLVSSTDSVLESSTTAGEDYPDSCVVFDHDIRLRDASIEAEFYFRAVQSMSVLYKRHEKTVTIACPYRAGHIIPLEVVLKEVRLPTATETLAEYESTMTTISNALQEVKSFDHASIVKVYSYKLAQVSECWEILVLSEKAQQSLYALLDMAGKITATKIRTFTRSILDALEFYDRKGYIHPAIHAHNILLFGSESTSYRSKLSDGYGTTLRDLVDRAQSGQVAETRAGNWAAPEVIGPNRIRSNKTCIWELGVVLLQMALGNDMTSRYTSPEDALSQAEFDQDFDHLVSKMCSTSARKRPTAFQLHSFQFFKNHEDSVFAPESKRLKTGSAAITRMQAPTDSRWASEWEPVEKLGKGGFGTVFKARHRLDGYLYAVKQLKCRSVRDTEDIWGEVRMLAQLNHPGVVRYFLAWNEDVHQDMNDTETSTAMTDPRSFAPTTDSLVPRNSIFAVPSTGHDFMDPSLAQLSDVEDDEEERQSVESDSSDSGNMFGYQSAPSDDDSASQAVESEGDEAEDVEINTDDAHYPFELHEEANAARDETNVFESPSGSEQQGSYMSSKPRPFVVAKGTPSALRRPPQYYNRHSVLYIQMELCETGTLFDLIRSGLPNDIDEGWRIFRLVLDGIEYIHARGIVHRDLKPMNIFIDAQKMPKIGDFGLASASQASTDGHQVATHIAGPMSRGAGTLFYIAPELEDSSQAGRFSTKADMFALGVIFFEMCFSFRTATERINWMQKVNQESPVLPDRFGQDDYKIQGRIIQSLLRRDPSTRPSAKDLMLDPEVPEPLEEDKERRYFQRLLQGDPQQLKNVLKSFMNRQATKSESLAYAYIEKEDFAQADTYLLACIQRKLDEVFIASGAVENNRETTFPTEGFYPSPVKFLDLSGFTVQLPYDLTVPFARELAVQKPKYEKYYCFGSVFRPRKEPGLEPMRIPEVDYDIVSYSARDLSLKDAQAISVLDDCIQKLAPLFVRSFCIIISHGDLLDLVLKACEVPESRFDIVKSLLSSLNIAKTTWKQVRPELQSATVGLAATTVTALSQFDFAADFDGMRRTVLTALKKLKKDDLATKAARTLNRLQEVNEFLRLLRVRTPIQFSPLSNTSEALYQGSVMFKCVESKSLKAVFVGGRYDTLIRSYQTPSSKTFARAVGFRINITDLAFYAKIDSQRTAGRSNRHKLSVPGNLASRIDVVVTSFDESTLYNTCIEIVRDLLDAGISAELSGTVSNMDELDQSCATLTRYWVVIVRPGGTKIKVRSPTKDETEVTSSELVTYLREELGERTTFANTEPVLRRTRSSHGASERENVTILTPKHKSKKVNRAAVVDSARTAAQDLTDNMSKVCKVLAVDTDDETLQKIRNTRLPDAESWRALRHLVNLNERDYIQEIQQQLHDWCEAGQQGAFLCNYKTKSCIFYDFGKV